MAAHRVEPSENTLKIHGFEEARGKLYEAQMILNFAKDEEGAIRFHYEQAQYRYHKAILAGSDQPTSLFLKHEQYKTRLETQMDRINQARYKFEDVDSLFSIYKDIMAQYRPDQIQHEPLSP